jgi:hypothetical protein
MEKQCQKKQFFTDLSEMPCSNSVCILLGREAGSRLDGRAYSAIPAAPMKKPNAEDETHCVESRLAEDR